LWREDALGKTLQVSRSERKKALSNAWRRAGFWRPARQQKRDETWNVHAWSSCAIELVRELFRQSGELIGKMK
jgi:hypothetical protein